MSARLRSLYLTLALATAVVIPAHAQFAITVQQNGQAFSSANGASISLNAPAVNQTANANVTITYLGTNSVVFSSARLTGSTSFTAAANANSISNAQSTAVAFSYTPQTAAQATASFLWPYTERDAAGNVITSGAILFNLVGTAPNISLGQVSAAGSLVPIPSGGLLAFPDTPVNSTSKVTFLVSNSGSGPATINSFAVSGAEFDVQGLPLFPLTVAAGNQLSLALIFTPLTPGAKTGSVQLSLPGGTLSVVLSGRAVTSFLSYQLTQNNNSAPLPAGQTIDLGDVKVGATTSAVIQFQNTGTTPLVVSTVAISGAGFTITAGPFLPVTLQPQQTNSITIMYTPTQPGVSNGRLIIGSDAFPVTARGLGPLFQLSYAQGTDTVTLGAAGTVSFSPIPPGQSEFLDFTLTNTGNTPSPVVSVGVLDTKGVFQVTRLAPLPLQLDPGASTTFRVTFSPQTAGLSSTTLVINNQIFGLSGFGSQPLQYSYKTGTATVVTTPGDTLIFQPLAVGQTGTIQFTITNPGASSVPISGISVIDTKGVFQLLGLPRLPLQLAPNATITFAATFTPQAAGQTTTTLLINDQTFALSGFASAPGNLPSYHFTGASGTQQPFQQPSVGLTLDATYPALITGTLVLTTVSNNFGTDPAVQFSSGGRQVAFTIPAGSLDAVFATGLTQIRLQTGTVAQNITITPSFSAGPNGATDITPQTPTRLQIVIPPLAPVLLGASLGSRTLTSFSVTISGFSTTRLLDHLTVQFTPSSGSSIGVNSVTIDVSAAARVWFQSNASQNLGGQFTIDIPFTLGNGSTGSDLTKSLSSVSVTASNEVGTSNAVKVDLP